MPAENEHDLLQEWRLKNEAPASFNSAVWRRIEKLPASPRNALAEWFSALFNRPAVAVSYASFALVIGLAAGHWQASKDLRAQETNLMGRYIQSVDPYASPALR